MSSLTYAQKAPPSHTEEGISILKGMQTASIVAERGGTLERIAAVEGGISLPPGTHPQFNVEQDSDTG